jgi:hypothetical protein
LLVHRVVAATRSLVTVCGKLVGCSIPQTVAKGESPLDDEGMSPNESEPDSVSLRKSRMANLSEVAKPATDWEVTSIGTSQVRRDG